MKKKLIAFAFILVIMCSFAFGAVNGQTVYSVTDSTFSDICTLYNAQGLALPSSSGPWTGNELSLMLQKINRDSLSSVYQVIYDDVEKALNPKSNVSGDTFGLNFGFDVFAEAYCHTNGSNDITKDYDEYKYDIEDQYTGKSDWFHGVGTRKPVFTLKMDNWGAKNFYSYFELSLFAYDWSYLYKRTFSSNLTVLTGVPAAGVKPIVLYSYATPLKALVTLGGEHWSLIAGRDKLSWGHGETGNLLLSKSFETHTMAKFSSFHDRFKYTFLGTVYPYYEEIYTSQNYYLTDKDIDGFKTYLAHRIEYGFPGNKFNIAVTEGCMYRITKDYTFGLATINPFGLMHNENKPNYGNSILFFEMDFVPKAGVNFYMQGALDDYAVSTAADSANPDGFGALVGAKRTFAFGPGIVKLNFEGVMTSPFLYLRGNYNANEYGTKKIGSYGFGFDGVSWFGSGCGGTVATNNFITYTYGNDVLLFDAKAIYEIPHKIQFGLEYMLMFKGVMDINSPWGTGGTVDSETRTPSEIDPYSNGKDGTPTTGAIEISNIISLAADYTIPVKGLNIYGIADYVHKSNYNNVSDATLNDFQFTFGVGYKH